MKWGGRNSICVKLNPASCKSKKMQEINVLQKCAPHALYLAPIGLGMLLVS